VGHLASGRQLVDKAGRALDSIIRNSGKVLDSIKQVTQSSESRLSTLHIGRNMR
jgi:methyl-accepting chemotaxis protein